MGLLTWAGDCGHGDGRAHAHHGTLLLRCVLIPHNHDVLLQAFLGRFTLIPSLSSNVNVWSSPAARMCQKWGLRGVICARA